MSDGRPVNGDPRTDLAHQRTGMASFRTKLVLLERGCS